MMMHIALVVLLLILGAVVLRDDHARNVVTSVLTGPFASNHVCTLDVAKQCKWFDGPHGYECNPLGGAQSLIARIPIAQVQQCAGPRLDFNPSVITNSSFEFEKEIHYHAPGDEHICSDTPRGCTIPSARYVQCPPGEDPQDCFFDSIMCLSIPIITLEQEFDLEHQLGYQLRDAYTYNISSDVHDPTLGTTFSPRFPRSLALRNLDALLDFEVALTNSLSPHPRMHSFYSADRKLPVFTSYLQRKAILSRVANVGDFSSFPIVQYMLDHKAQSSDNEARVTVSLSSTFEFATPAFISALGSIIDAAGVVPWARKAYWGSGLIMNMNFTFQGLNLFYGVRGPWTRRYLAVRQAVNTPVVKDPGLLLPQIFPRPYFDEADKAEIGFFLHMVDFPVFMRTSFFKVIHPDHVVSNWGHFEQTITKLLGFKRIVSSSLHGVIFAHAYGIPCLAVAMSKKVIGGDFKFADYYHSIGYDQFEGRVNFHAHDGNNLTHWIDMVDRYWQPAKADLDTSDLYRSFPFGG